MKETISRRNFFKGALATGTVMAGAGLVGCAGGGSPAKADAPTADVAGGEKGRWSWSVKPDPITDVAETIDCDVLIIGAGAAGVPAAMYAGLEDIDTVVMQKEATVQTNGQGFGTWNNEWGTEQGIEWDIPTTMQAFADLANGKANLKLVKNVLERTGECSKLIIENIPEPKASPAIVDGYVAYRWLYDDDLSTRYKAFADLYAAMGEKAAEHGVNFLYSTPAVQLIVDESGAVTGAIGERKGGEYVQVNARKGVVLATGDISDDDEMLEAYCPVMLGMPTLHAVATNTGDGHKMGMWAGAKMDTPSVGLMMHFDPTPLPQGAAPFSAVPWLHVNVNAERFTNENVGYQALATAVAMQPEHRAFQIIDSHLLEHAFDYTNGGRPADEKALNGAVEAGQILKADTIEELAGMAGLDAAALQKTIDRYNELVDKGNDEDFGMASEFFVWNGIKDAPFYAIERMPGKLAVCGGLASDERCRALKEDGTPVPNLYVSGNVQGSFFGYDYPVVGFGGFSLSRAATGGILAVKQIMGTFDEPIA